MSSRGDEDIAASASHGGPAAANLQMGPQGRWPGGPPGPGGVDWDGEDMHHLRAAGGYPYQARDPRRPDGNRTTITRSTSISARWGKSGARLENLGEDRVCVSKRPPV